jgi:hypothetical protein
MTHSAGRLEIVNIENLGGIPMFKTLALVLIRSCFQQQLRNLGRNIRAECVGNKRESAAFN